MQFSNAGNSYFMHRYEPMTAESRSARMIGQFGPRIRPIRPDHSPIWLDRPGLAVRPTHLTIRSNELIKVSSGACVGAT